MKILFFCFPVPPTPMDVVLNRNANNATNTVDVAWVIQTNQYYISSFTITLISSNAVKTTHKYSDIPSGTNFSTTINGLIPGEEYTARVKSQSGNLYSQDSVASSPTRLSK